MLGKLGGNIGLVITQAFGLAGMLQLGLRQSAELENHMSAVERVLEYTQIPQDAVLESTSSDYFKKKILLNYAGNENDYN